MAIRQRPASFVWLGALLFLAVSTVIVHAAALHVVAFGDSLTAGLGLPLEQAFPTRLQAALKARGLDVAIDNAGVSGDTAADGLARLDWSVPDGTKAVLLELGANDMLRGMDPGGTRTALDAVIERLKGRGIAVMLLGMRAAPNFGADYQKSFDGLYGALAVKHGIALYSFYLDGVAGDAALNQNDGIHPNAKGVDIIVGKIVGPVEAFLRGLPQ
jgi:acyl-CoA thioesterase-1